MSARTPITIITGPLGSGKTTLLRHLLDSVSKKLAIVMNEFGEVAIDSKILEGKNIRIAELVGGCVCCSLTGEFEAAVNELIDAVKPEQIVLETTGVAEPGALLVDIEQNLTRVRLDGTVSVIDADGLLRYPSLGHTTRTQIESADLLLLNKTDLAQEKELPALEEKLRSINTTAPIVRTRRSHVNPDLLFGIALPATLSPAEGERAGVRGRFMVRGPQPHVHQPDFDSFSYSTSATFDRDKFEHFAASLFPEVYRTKGFIRFPDGTHLFNFVAGRWDFESFAHERTELVFIGQRLAPEKDAILARLKACEELHAL